MSELLSVLMKYADDTFKPSPAYWEAMERLNTRQKALETGLTPQQQEALDALLEADSVLHAMDAETVFHAGLTMGMELGDLISPRKRTRTRCR